ncbi:MAG TPA: radical SAM protein [Dehalococcoidia bacterium]|nr:radical SAM protein [Dehalococcoidia bacterium]
MNWKTLKEARGKLAAEQGTIFKDWGGRIHIALVYPNSYSSGMSNLGFQTIYGFLNQYDRVVCERAFYDGCESVSLESQRPLTDFDILAFSFSYELDYFSAAHLLKSSGIPVFASDRGEHHPLLIAGGPAVMANPEPLASLLDCFAIGESEAILPQMMRVILDDMELPRYELLQKLSILPGVYVPTMADLPIARQSAPNLSDFLTGSVVLTPDTEFGDLYLMEIARGCSRGCRFCLAGYHFRPMRHRPLENLLEQARQGLRYRKRLGLVSAAITDHPQIDELVTGLRRMGAQFSVSSLRIKPLSDALLKGLAESGTRTISLAPEAGSQRMREVVKKAISEDDILRAVDQVASHGLKQLKLYFMIGLPTETEDDIMDIVSLARTTKDILDRRRSGTRLTLNIAVFVPKAGTPFQCFPMAAGDVLNRRLSFLKKGLSRKGIAVKADSIDWSLVQGTLSRGNSRLGEVVAGMPETSLSAWRKAVEGAGLDPDLIHREIPCGEQLPWWKINSGVRTEYLRSELEGALADERWTLSTTCRR